MMRWSISVKIITLNIFIALLVALIVTIVSIRQITRQVEESLSLTGESLQQNLLERIRNDVEKSQRFAELLSGNQELHQLLKNQEIGILQEWLDNQSEIEIYALLEIFDSGGKPLVVNRWLNKPKEEVNYLTNPEDDSLIKAQDYLISLEIKALPEGLTIKTVVPIVDWETVEILGIMAVSFPMNQEWIDLVRGRSPHEFTITTNSSERLATTIVTPEGKRMEKLPLLVKTSIGQSEQAKQIDKFLLFDRSYMVRISPIYDLRSIEVGKLIVWMRRDLIEATTEKILQVLLFVSLATALGCVVLGAFMARTLTTPLRNLVQTVESIASGQLKQRIDIKSGDEIGDLALAVGSMQNDLKISHALVQQMLKTFQLFVPSQFLRYIAHDGVENVKLGNAKQEIASVLFLDIRSFTTRTENMRPQGVLDFLNELFHNINPSIEQEGFIDKFIGDAVMAIFEEEMDPIHREKGAKPSVMAALGILASLKKYNLERDSAIRVGIGINTGPIIFGTVGSSSRMDSTVLGNTVNVASRVENLTKQYEVNLLITDATLASLGESPPFLIREIDKVRVKGKQEAITIYEVFDEDEENIRNAKLNFRDEFQQGLQLYQSKKWEESLKLFESIQTNYPEDRLIGIYIERCRSFMHHSPSEDWDGVYTMESK
ncbi:MAG: HAMP domain-containing protein [SAR324 cluster bacterium]|nr:HAMP domain-containing protein [SAR324 cluster bacterium]